MSGLAIAFTAEAAVPIAHSVIDAIGSTPLPWAAAAAGLVLLFVKPLRNGFLHAWDCVIKTH